MKLLTYNICWCCMGPDKGTSDSAKKLCDHCHSSITSGENTCLDNVVDNIVSGGLYDIIHLQEVKNIDIIHEKLNIKTKTKDYELACINYEKEKNGNIINISTLYNYKKLKILYFDYLDLTESHKTDCRPVLICLFKDLGTKNSFFSINIHAPHDNIDFNAISNVCDNLKKNKIVYSSPKFKGQFYGTILEKKIYKASSDSEKYELNSLDDSLIYDNLSIIFGGDTNDHGKKKYWSSDYWNKNKINKYYMLSFNSNIEKIKTTQPPKSCCSTNITKLTKDNYTLYGDYFMVSELLDSYKKEHNNYFKQFYITSPNKILDNVIIPSSDHLPVEVEIEFKDNVKSRNTNNTPSTQPQLNILKPTRTTHHTTHTTTSHTTPKQTEHKKKTKPGFRNLVEVVEFGNQNQNPNNTNPNKSTEYNKSKNTVTSMTMNQYKGERKKKGKGEEQHVTVQRPIISYVTSSNSTVVIDKKYIETYMNKILLINI